MLRCQQKYDSAKHFKSCVFSVVEMAKRLNVLLAFKFSQFAKKRLAVS